MGLIPRRFSRMQVLGISTFVYMFVMTFHSTIQKLTRYVNVTYVVPHPQVWTYIIYTIFAIPFVFMGGIIIAFKYDNWKRGKRREQYCRTVWDEILTYGNDVY